MKMAWGQDDDQREGRVSAQVGWDKREAREEPKNHMFRWLPAEMNTQRSTTSTI